MLESVPEANHGDARFRKSLTLAGHLAGCRENWLEHMEGKGRNIVDAWDEKCELSEMYDRFANLENRWTNYLANLPEEEWSQKFTFTESNGDSFELPVGVQVIQLAGHASYHRGQIALLVGQLGGEIKDTDYADWWWEAQ